MIIFVEKNQNQVEILDRSQASEKSNEDALYECKETQSFDNISSLCQMIFKMILMNLNDKSHIRKLSFKIQMSIVNFMKEHFSLEVALKNGFLFGKECFTFICYDKSVEHKIMKMREMMIGSISHELRTPLNS